MYQEEFMAVSSMMEQMHSLECLWLNSNSMGTQHNLRLLHTALQYNRQLIYLKNKIHHIVVYFILMERKIVW